MVIRIPRCCRKLRVRQEIAWILLVVLFCAVVWLPTAQAFGTSAAAQRPTLPSSALFLSTTPSGTTDGFSNVTYLPQEEEEEERQSHAATVRPCRYNDLPAVADVIVAAFYRTDHNIAMQQLYRLAELSQRQQNFAYPAEVDRHAMYVAVQQDDTLIGFCDVDQRPANRPTGFPTNPRPYLSDLCVHPAAQGHGVGQALVQACEEHAIRYQWKNFEDEGDATLSNEVKDSGVPNFFFMYIRVETTNVAALGLYQKAGYVSVRTEGEQLVLRKRITAKV